MDSIKKRKKVVPSLKYICTQKLIKELIHTKTFSCSIPNTVIVEIIYTVIDSLKHIFKMKLQSDETKDINICPMCGYQEPIDTEHIFKQINYLNSQFYNQYVCDNVIIEHI